MKRRGIYNRILVPAAALLLTVMSIFGIREMMVSSVALEQEVRCGIEAHAHSGECYEGHRRVCGKEEHHHSRNCYLVLLEENDINRLLVQMSDRTDNSLEGVISQTVDNALVYNVNLTSPLAEGTTLADVAALNRTVEENNVQPAVVFNENIQSSSASGDLMGAALPSAGGASTLSVGESTNSNNYWANYYVYLDGSWQTVGKLQFSVSEYGSSYNRRYRAQESMTEVLNLYNGALGTSLTANEVDYQWSTNNNTNSFSDTYTSGNYLVFGDGYYRSNSNDARRARYVRLVEEDGTPMAFYTVTLYYDDGSDDVYYVRGGTSFTLPEDYTWNDGDEDIAGGTTVTINGTTSFHEVVAGGLRINYDVNFPTTVSGVTISTRPTMQGMAQTAVTDTIEENATARIRNVSQQEVKGTVNGNTTGLTRVVRFMGWRVDDSDVIISPNANLSWEELRSLVGNGKTLRLYGVWEYNPLQTVSFFVRYDSVAVDTEGSIGGQDSTKYTNEIFSAFVMGVDTSLSTGTLTDRYGVADETADNSFTADQEIRALYGQKEEGVWLTGFPTDEHVFQLLKQDTTGKLRVDGEVVDPANLNDNVYTIRWFVFKSQSDAWHIDGRLVKKEGILDVSKSFAGNKEAVAAAKDGFYIRLSHQERSDVHYLYLTTPATAPTDGDVYLPDPARSSDNYFIWRVEGFTYGDPWIAEEHTGESTGVIVHSDYRIVDTYGDQSRSGTGATMNFYGSTIATDMDVWYPLTINFTNIYHNTDSIIIKKEDALTGSPIGGAVFQLTQNGQVMSFNYDPVSETYFYDPINGTITELSGSLSGYYELNIQGFSYDDGSIVVKELQAPVGYTPIENVEIGYRQKTLLMMMPPVPPAEALPEATPTSLSEETVVEAIDETLAAAPPVDTGQALDSGQAEEVEESLEALPVEEEPVEEQLTEEPPVEEPLVEEEPETVLVEEVLEGEMLMAADAQAEEPVIELLSASTMVSYNNGLLIIRNSTESTSVTVNKEWLCPAEEWQEVTVQLMANDAPVTSLISGVELTKVLNAGNNWTATWSELPLYANGEEIVWSVKEIKIGNENCLGNYTFVNWLVDYSPATYTYEGGKLTNTAFTITNDTYRTLLRLVKTNIGGGIRLEGAVFRLEHLIDGQPDSEFMVRTMTTGADGLIIFDNLKYGDYRLTEIQPPGGYLEMTQPIYLTIQSNGTVVVQDHPYALAGTTAYSIQVLNEQMRPLPSTGGGGTVLYYLGGIAIMMASAALFRKRKEARYPVE